MYDIKRILEDTDSFHVAQYIGMEVLKRGAYYFIHCPGHIKNLGKKDIVAKNCILTSKGYKCFACGAEGNVIDMVQNYYKYELEQNITFPEILGLIGDSLGGRNLYLLNEGEIKSSPTLRLTAEDYSIIGLKQNYCFDSFKNMSNRKEETEEKWKCKETEDFDKTGLYIYYEEEKFSFNKLREECPELFYKIIKEYAKKAINKYKQAIKDYGDRNAPKVTELIKFSKDGVVEDDLILALKNRFTKKYERAMEIYQEAMYAESEETPIENTTIETIKENKKEEFDYYEMFG